MARLIDVVMDDEEVMLAKIVDESDTTYKVKYLNLVKDGTLYKYTREIYEIEKECVSGFYGEEDDEEDAGFTRVEGGYIPNEMTSEYAPSDDEVTVCYENESDIESDQEFC